MNNILLFIADALKTQGVSFLILGLAVWYLQGQNIELRKDLQTCQETKIELLLKVVEGNTFALKNIQDLMSQPKKKNNE
jgi:hypothetical protein